MFREIRDGGGGVRTPPGEHGDLGGPQVSDGLSRQNKYQRFVDCLDILIPSSDALDGLPSPD